MSLFTAQHIHLLITHSNHQDGILKSDTIFFLSSQYQNPNSGVMASSKTENEVLKYLIAECIIGA